MTAWNDVTQRYGCVAFASLTVALAGAGCGGADPSEEAKAAVGSFLTALEDEDYVDACDLLSAKAMEVGEYASHAECVRAYETTGQPLWDFRVERVAMRSSRAGDVFVRLKNDSETGRRFQRRYTFPVSRYEDRWLLDSD